MDKKIYYFWCGGPMTKYAKCCMETWKRFMPDFEIIRIPEEYIDMNLKWNQRAYNKKNWAYLSDTARVNFLRSHSGIYLDTDMFFCKRIPDEMLNSSLFAWCEHNKWICQGVIGKDTSDKVNELFEDWYKIYTSYNKNKFIPSPQIFDMLDKEKYDLNPSEEVYINKYNMRFYGTKYFDPVRWHDKKKQLFFEETVAIHLGTASAIVNSVYSKDRIVMFDKQKENILKFLKSRKCDDLYNRDYSIENQLTEKYNDEW